MYLQQTILSRDCPQLGSTTDLTPTLIGIYDSLLEPVKSLRPEANRLETAKDARNDPPVQESIEDNMTEEKDATVPASPPKDPSKIAGSIKLPIATINKSSLFTLRTKSDNNGAIESKCDLTSDTVKEKVQRTFKEINKETTTFDNLSPNVKRMISGAAETTTLKFQKKSITIGRSSTRRCNIPLVGATSKISQSGLEILPSVEIYDQPTIKTFSNESPAKTAITVPLIKPDFKINDEQTTYDVPSNNQPAIYDVPNLNKTAFETLSLPFIDQSIELSISCNDREFDTKLPSKDSSPQKPEPKTSTPEASPIKFPKNLNDGTNSLHRKNFGSKTEGSPSKLLKTGPYPEAVASTGNLKMIQEKEVIRLNPAIEVTRPLSMSSIASSSSTSSSGVQNKGGVNSAYLASIESLDDHSDADMTSANGSNNFVNSAGMLKTSVSEDSRTELPRQNAFEEMPGLSQLERVCAEIVQTENVYVEDLRQVVEAGNVNVQEAAIQYILYRENK
ncbi:jg6783 [Pararge aegeria aegeria]|uniref:Jg6783 protein n=1 Tax=Pararge aegeria aegeria TaxID=348720 RepID=A0A8S4RT75_9NEOP|nr:jg6783 [Pararge aegeria aegeria]